MTQIPAHLVCGPKDNVDYPLSVQYCGNCSMPLEVNTYNTPFPPIQDKNINLTNKSFLFRSTANIIPNMKSARRGWRRICPTCSPR